MKTLLAQIYEPGSVHDTALKYKRGLVTALEKQGPIEDFDYLANDPATLYDGFVIRLNNFQPDLVLTQFHSAEHLRPDQIQSLKALRPEATFVNWSGDSWAHSLTAPPVLELARAYDLWLVAAPDTLPTYADNGIRAAYWNIAYEPPVEPYKNQLPDMPKHDVVWLANLINDHRRVLMERLKALEGELNIKVGIYGDWEHADGNTVYNFPAGEALYKNATLAIADNVYQDTQNYVSNRPMQVMAAGNEGKGALLLHQHVPTMEAMTGWKAGTHYIEWQDADELVGLIKHWLNPKQKATRAKIVKTAQKQVLAKHTWDERVRVLTEELLPSGNR